MVQSLISVAIFITIITNLATFDFNLLQKFPLKYFFGYFWKIGKKLVLNQLKTGFGPISLCFDADMCCLSLKMLFCISEIDNNDPFSKKKLPLGMLHILMNGPLLW